MKVTYEVIPWYNARYKGQIRVEGHDVEKAFFDDFRTAERWCKAKVQELITALAY
jgi:hypothetical protein